MAGETRNVVVLHASTDPGDVQRALSAAETLAAALGETDPQLHIRIIVNGAALDGLTGTEAVILPANTGVEACLNGMGRRGLTTDQLRPAVGTVPAAVVALAQAQFAGAAYIRI